MLTQEERKEFLDFVSEVFSDSPHQGDSETWDDFYEKLGKVREEPTKLIEILETIKDPKIASDREETIEQDVGDSVSEAYIRGRSDGKKQGKYELAQELLKLIKGVP